MKYNKIGHIVALSLFTLATSAQALEYKHKTPVTGLLPPGNPYIHLSPTGLTFPATPVGGSSSLSVSVSNPDSFASLVGLRAVLDTNAFTLDTNSCGTVATPVELHPLANCTAVLKFTPSAVGNYTGTLALAADNSTNGVQSVLLSAQATGSESISQTSNTPLSATVIQGDSHAYPFTFVNNGNIASNSTYVTLTGDSELYVQSNTCGTSGSPVSLTPAGSCSVTVLGSSIDVGSFNSVLNLYSAGNSASAQISRALTLISEAPPASTALVVSGNPAAFGTHVLGTSAPVSSVTISNVGNIPMTLTGVTGLPSEVTLTNNTCSNVAVQGSCSLSFTMSTSATTAFNNIVNTVGATSNTSFNMTGFVIPATAVATVSNGSVSFGTVVYSASNSNFVDRSVSVTNTGNSALTIGSVSGLPSSVVFESTTCANVAVSGTCSLVFRMNSNGTTSFTNTSVTLNGATSQDPVLLSGSVVSPTSVAFASAGAPVSFGSVIQGTTAPTATVTIRNDGNSNMTLGTTTGLHSSVTQSGNTCSNIVPNGTCSLTFTMSTASPTTFAGVTAATSGASTNATFNVSGTVVAATSVASVTSGSPFTFAAAQTGGSNPTSTVAIKNNGNSNMTITGMAGLPTGVTANVSACSAIAPAASCNIVFTLSTNAVTSFNNVTATTVGATDNANITMTGAVTDSFAASDVFVAPFISGFTDTKNAAASSVNGNAAISSNRTLFGNSTATFDGNGDYVRYSTANSNVLFPGGTAFTMEGWVYIAADSTPDQEGSRGFTLISAAANTNANTAYTEFSIGGSTTTTGTSIYMWSDVAGNAIGASYTFNKNTWYHVAVTRTTANVVSYYVNGTYVGGGTWATQFGFTGAQISLGGRNSSSNHYKYLNGNLSNMRITKGAVRYTGNFTPPTAPF